MTGNSARAFEYGSWLICGPADGVREGGGRTATLIVVVERKPAIADNVSTQTPPNIVAAPKSPRSPYRHYIVGLWIL